MSIVYRDDDKGASLRNNNNDPLIAKLLVAAKYAFYSSCLTHFLTLFLLPFPPSSLETLEEDLWSNRCGMGRDIENSSWSVSPSDSAFVCVRPLMISHHVGLGGNWDTNRAVVPKLGDDGLLEAMGGDTYILLARWNADGDLTAYSSHQFGAAVTKSTSPHFDDQVSHASCTSLPSSDQM